MAILPRRHRGTWLFAGLVWLASCAGLHCLLPFSPGAMWNSAKQGSVLGVWGDRLLVCNRSIITKLTFAYSSVPLDCGPATFVSIKDGSELTTCLTSNDTFRETVQSRSGRWLAIVGHDWWNRESLWLLDGSSAKVTTGPRNIGGIDRVAFAADEQSLFYLSNKGLMGQLSIPDLKPLGQSRDVAFVFGVSHNGRFVAAASPDGDSSLIEIRDSATRELISQVRTESPPYDLTVSDDGLVIVGRLVTLSVGTWCCWSARDGRLLLRATGYETRGTNTGGCAVAPNGKKIATLGADGRLAIWDVATGNVLSEHGQEGQLQVPLRMSPHGSVVAIRRQYRESRIQRMLTWLSPRIWNFDRDDLRPVSMFDLETGQHMWDLPGDLNRARWSPDGSILAAGSWDGATIRVWDLPPRKSLTWFAAGSALLALPIGFAAWRRGRKLRAA